MLDFYLTFLFISVRWHWHIEKVSPKLCQHFVPEVTKLKNKSISYFLCLFPFYRAIFENTLFGKIHFM